MPRNLPPPLSALEVRLGLTPGTLDDVDADRAKAALADATVLILAEVSPTKALRWSVDAPAVVHLVALKAARREYDNPQGLQSETLGEHTIGVSETSGVYLTAREVAQIVRADTGRRVGFIGSVRTPSAVTDLAQSPQDRLAHR